MRSKTADRIIAKITPERSKELRDEVTKAMVWKTKRAILNECFLGVIDFNEAAALSAMEKYARQERRYRKKFNGPVWEYLAVNSYYDNWVVKRIDNKNFESPETFHLIPEKEAETLCKLLNDYESD